MIVNLITKLRENLRESQKVHDWMRKKFYLMRLIRQ